MNGYLEANPRPRKRLLGLANAFLQRANEASRATVEMEAIAVRHATVSSRNELIVREYFGFGSCQTSTLESIGKKYGVTRERIRQICSRHVCECNAPDIFLPAFRRAAAVLESSEFMLSAEREQELAANGVVEPGTTVGELVNYATRIGLPLTVMESGQGGSRRIVPVGFVDQSRVVLSILRRLSVRHGAAEVTRLKAELERTRSSICSAEEIEDILASDHSVVRSQLDKRWYWNSSSGDRGFSRRVQRILSVAGTILLRDLRQALRRDYRDGGIVPPLSVLGEVVASIPQVVVNHDFVRTASTSPLPNFRGSRDEVAIVQLLQAKDGVSDRRVLQKEAVAIGISLPNFWRCLSYSTLITRFAEGVYGTVGKRLPPDVVAEIQANRKAVSGGVLDRGWTPNGELWIAYRLSDSAVETGVIGIPHGACDIVNGDYRLHGEGEYDYGTLRVSNGQAWGFRSALVALGAEPGDCMVLQINQQQRQSQVSIGDESLVDRIVDAT